MLSYDTCLSLSDLNSLSVFAANGNLSFPIMAVYCSTLYMYRVFICSAARRHLGCFCVLPIVNSAAMNIGTRVSFQSSVFFRYMSTSGIAGPCDSSVFRFLKEISMPFSVVAVPPLLAFFSFFSIHSPKCLFFAFQFFRTHQSSSAFVSALDRRHIRVVRC